MSLSPDPNSSFVQARNKLLAEITTLQDKLNEICSGSGNLKPVDLSLETLKKILRVLFAAVPLRFVELRYGQHTGRGTRPYPIFDLAVFPFVSELGKEDPTKEWFFAVRMIVQTFGEVRNHGRVSQQQWRPSLWHGLQQCIGQHLKPHTRLGSVSRKPLSAHYA